MTAGYGYSPIYSAPPIGLQRPWVRNQPVPPGGGECWPTSSRRNHPRASPTPSNSFAAQRASQSSAQNHAPWARPGGPDRGRRGGPGAAASPNLLAGRRRAPDYLGADDHPKLRRGAANLGIYRQQIIGPNRIIMRWLSHRGGALDFAAWQAAKPREPFPVAVSIGADPATTLAAVTPIPDSLSEYAFAGLLRGRRTELVRCLGSTLRVPAHAEITLEGRILPDDMAKEGPFGDHTGYYNEVETFPVMTVDRITPSTRAHLPHYLHRTTPRRTGGPWAGPSTRYLCRS